MAPKVSIFTLSYNHRPFLEARIESIRQQTMQDFEWIIIDDASQDGSGEVLQKLRGHPKVKAVILNEKNRGPYEAHNQALELCEGEYIYRAEADDMCDARLLEAEVYALDSFPSVGLVHTCSSRIDSEGNFLSYFRKPPSAAISEDGKRVPVEVTPSRRAWLREVVKNYICSPSVMFRRECYERLGPFLVSLGRHADWEYWLRILSRYDAAYIPVLLCSWRHHRSNLTGPQTAVTAYEALVSGYTIQKAAFRNPPRGLRCPQVVAAKARRASSISILQRLVITVRERRYALSVRALVALITNDPGVFMTRDFGSIVLRNFVPGGEMLRRMIHGSRHDRA